jgi:hypothetical protein
MNAADRCMYSALTTFITQLSSSELARTSILPWSCPVPFFGGLTTAHVATVGLNPSNREFTNDDGDELIDLDRRLPTLHSLNRPRWDEVDSGSVKEVFNACRTYFARNPYTRWFGVLQRLLAPSGYSYYGEAPSACHIDLVAYATVEKWGALPSSERRALLRASADAVARLIRDSHIRLLILNGSSVLDHFQALADATLQQTEMPSWSLCRDSANSVRGYAYSGAVTSLAGVELWRTVRVIGYNHNLQSSFGVTKEVLASIAAWVQLTCEREGM